MQYALLIYTDESATDVTRPPEELAPMLEGYRAFGEEYHSAIRGGQALQPTATATSVRVRDGRRLLTDGPFAETREQLGGFYIVDVDSLDDAIAAAAKIPGASTGVVEVRPVMVFADSGQPSEAARGAGAA
jgi:hypothetical protein